MISALVRSGAVSRAQGLFEAHGYGREIANPAALAVRGSLLKARARQAALQKRNSLLVEARSAYEMADELSPAPYLAINVATLSLLIGDVAKAENVARDILSRLDAGDGSGDTPYFLSAARAEALLVLGDTAGAAAAMSEAARADPDGWDDRAVTVRQLVELCDFKGVDAAWLVPFRPPSTMHFAGHMGFKPEGTGEAELRASIDALIVGERIGFGFGALAAGADIIIAEALLESEAALHVVLPVPPELFRHQSVIPAGAAWVHRYDRALARATAIYVAGPVLGESHNSLATALAADFAAGSAILKARSLSSGSIQVIILDQDGGGADTANQAAVWPPDLRQIRLEIDREFDPRTVFLAEQSDPAQCEASLLAIRMDVDRLGQVPAGEPLRRAHRLIHDVLGHVPRERIRVGPGRWDILLDSAEESAELAAAISAIEDTGSPLASVGLARGIVTVVADEVTDRLVPYGSAVEEASALALRAPLGIALATEIAAVGLALIGKKPWSCELYARGDGASGQAIYLIRNNQ